MLWVQTKTHVHMTEMEKQQKIIEHRIKLHQVCLDLCLWRLHVWSLYWKWMCVRIVILWRRTLSTSERKKSRIVRQMYIRRMRLRQLEYNKTKKMLDFYILFSWADWATTYCVHNTTQKSSFFSTSCSIYTIFVGDVWSKLTIGPVSSQETQQPSRTRIANICGYCASWA